MGLMDSVFGSKSTVKSRSTLSKDQQKVLKQLSELVQKGLSTGATGSGLPSYVETPSILGSLFGTGEDSLVSALTRQATGQPAYTPDYGGVVSRFDKTYAQPMMSSWRENVLPMVREAFNIPGMAASSLASRGVTDAANRFYGESVAPRLFEAMQGEWGAGVSSLENAAGRQAAGAQSLMSLGQLQLSDLSRILAAQRGEEARMFPENNPWLSLAASVAMTPTIQNIGMQGSQGMFGQLLSGALGASQLGSMGFDFMGGLKSFF